MSVMMGHDPRYPHIRYQVPGVSRDHNWYDEISRLQFLLETGLTPQKVIARIGEDTKIKPHHTNMRLFRLLGLKCMCRECFTDRLAECAQDNTREEQRRPHSQHVQMIKEMTELLTFLGYHEGIKVFNETNRWYEKWYS